MAIEVELPDGSIAEFPDGTPKEVMSAAIRKRLQAAFPRTPEQQRAEEDRLTGTSINPTDGMSGPRRFAAGAGKSLRDTGVGVMQYIASGGPMAPGIDMARRFGPGQLRDPEDQNSIRSLVAGRGERHPYDLQGRFSDYADRLANENVAADQSLTDTRGGFWGNVGGVVGQMLLPGAVAKLGATVPRLAPIAPALRATGNAILPTSVRGAAAQGGALGMLMPVADGQSRAFNTLTGAAFGAGGAAAPRALGAGLRGLNRLVEPLREKGLENIVGRTLQRFAANPNLSVHADPILGNAPTLAESTLDSGIAQLQRAAMAKSPEVGNAIFGARSVANQARYDALRQYGGDPARRAAAEASIAANERASYGAVEGLDGVDVVPIVRSIDRTLAGAEGKRPAVRSALNEARRLFFEPYEDAARIRDARALIQAQIGVGRMSGADRDVLLEARRILANRANLSADEVVEQIDGLRVSSKTAQDALTEARGLVNSLNVAYEQETTRLLGARRAINDLISGKGENRNGMLAQGQLTEIRGMLDDAIRKVAPEIDQALDARRLGMQPINEMDTVDVLLKKGSRTVTNPTTGGLTRGLLPASFINPSDDLTALARSGTGFRKAQADDVLSGPAQQTIEGIRTGLARQRFADEAARGVGSPTAQYLAGGNIMDGILGQPKPGSFMAALANMGAAVADKPYAFAGVPERLNIVMARVLSSPAEAQRILAALPPPDRIMVEQAIGRLSAPVATGISAAQRRP